MKIMFFLGSNATITAVRIQGCTKEPCRIKKGTKLPYEIDFSFEAPITADGISVQAMASYWAVSKILVSLQVKMQLQLWIVFFKDSTRFLRFQSGN